MYVLKPLQIDNHHVFCLFLVFNIVCVYFILLIIYSVLDLCHCQFNEKVASPLSHMIYVYIGHRVQRQCYRSLAVALASIGRYLYMLAGVSEKQKV